MGFGAGGADLPTLEVDGLDYEMRAWIAGCVVEADGTEATLPSAAVCSTCTGLTMLAGPTDIAWDCAGGGSTGVATAASGPIGVVAVSGCSRLGLDDQLGESAWDAEAAGSTRPDALCCPGNRPPL
jgi:hypothetical protein